MELVTVTCIRDLHLMKLQASSIDRFIKKPCVHHVIIEDNAMSIDEWRKHLVPFYTRHTLKLSQTDLQLQRNGWIRQQVLKLTIARQVLTDYYLILDSKVFFARPVELDNWPVIEGDDSRFDRTELLVTRWGEWINWVQQQTGKKIPANFWRIFPPFKMKTSSVLQMLADVDIVALFDTDIINVSEFLLYAFYTDAVPHSVAKSHHIIRNIESMPTKAEITEIVSNTNILSVAIHMKLINGGNPKLLEIKQWLLENNYDNDIVHDIFKNVSST